MIVSTSLVLAQEKPKVNLLLNFYPHHTRVKNDYDFSLDLGINISEKLSYFGFVNMMNVFDSESMRFQISEQSLRWTPATEVPVDLVYQHVIRKGADNDTIQLGARWRASNTKYLNDLFNYMHLNYSVQFFVKRVDQRINKGWQVSHGYLMKFPYLSERLYLTGFVDQNMDERRADGTKFSPIVGEAQFGVRIFRKLFAVAEYRINEYRENNKRNIGVGFELQMSW